MGFKKFKKGKWVIMVEVVPCYDQTNYVMRLAIMLITSVPNLKNIRFGDIPQNVIILAPLWWAASSLLDLRSKHKYTGLLLFDP